MAGYPGRTATVSSGAGTAFKTPGGLRARRESTETLPRCSGCGCGVPTPLSLALCAPRLCLHRSTNFQGPFLGSQLSSGFSLAATGGLYIPKFSVCSLECALGDCRVGEEAVGDSRWVCVRTCILEVLSQRDDLMAGFQALEGTIVEEGVLAEASGPWQRGFPVGMEAWRGHVPTPFLQDLDPLCFFIGLAFRLQSPCSQVEGAGGGCLWVVWTLHSSLCYWRTDVKHFLLSSNVQTQFTQRDVMMMTSQGQSKNQKR